MIISLKMKIYIEWILQKIIRIYSKVIKNLKKNNNNLIYKNKTIKIKIYKKLNKVR